MRRHERMTGEDWMREGDGNRRYGVVEVESQQRSGILADAMSVRKLLESGSVGV